ncbi:hypothetical protein [Sulfurovum sp.]|uniref:hypothetical protein n=1 Tax=Sulfurovum sp. TaxID=1969726 RepID=UPI0025EBE145|nr:hypothetical protein [Sulfurovum sp.]
MDKLKSQILLKADIVHRQNLITWAGIQKNKKMWDEVKKRLEPVYTQRMPKIIQDFFSDDLQLQEEGLKGFKGLLLIRPWENIDDTFRNNNEQKDKYKDNFVDDFNNFLEFYNFLEGLVSDVEEYHRQRVEN